MSQSWLSIQRTICFIVVFHKKERILINVTVEVNIGPERCISHDHESCNNALNTPVPPVFLNQRMSIEELNRALQSSKLS